MRTELTLSELEVQHAELLPERETLFFNSNVAQILASNSALALNAVTAFSNAQAWAGQSIVVAQS
jgi:hypothetical protein